MKLIIFPAMFFILFVTAVSAQTGKIITTTDEASPVPGTAVISDFHGSLPQSGPGNRTPPQMTGWPVTIGSAGNFAPSRGLVFADLDGDGLLEIITSSTDDRVYAWDTTGAAMPGFPVTVNEMAQKAPGVGDLDGDGDLEIVQFTRGWVDQGRLYIIDHLGNVLPGFPMNFNNNNLAGSPSLGDIDFDGDLEIIAGERDYPLGLLHVVEYDGTEWGGNWPVSLDHVPTGTAGVADVDNDGDLEITYMSYDSLYLLDTDGNHLPGWPIQIANCNFSYQSSAFADLDGDGDLEIIVGAHKDAAGCYAFHHDGTTVSGWPKLVGTWTYCPPTVTDLEGDGELEVLCGRAGFMSYPSDCFWAWTASGITKPGFPYRQSHGGGSEGPLTVADIDNDGLMEIFADHNMAEVVGPDLVGYLFGVDSNGNDLPGFPLRPSGFTYMNGATIGDVDGDGDIELGVLSSHDYGVDVNLYDLPEAYYPSNVGWETYHVRNERGGLYMSGHRLHEQGYMGIGSTIGLTIHDEPGQRAYILASLSAAKQYFPSFGWFYLPTGAGLYRLLDNAVIPGTGEITQPVNIPNNPGLIGQEVYFQGLTGTNPAAGQGSFTNFMGRVVH